MNIPPPLAGARLRPVFLPVFLCAALGLAGCAHYQLGTDGRLGFQTLYLAPVADRAQVPQASALVSTLLREEILRDGRVTLADSAAGADATLTVVLAKYHRDVAAVRPDDTGLAREFTLTLDATVTLHDNRSGKDLVVRRPVDAARNAFTDSGQLQSEYQALPLLAGVLAKKVAHTALDVW